MTMNDKQLIEDLRQGAVDAGYEGYGDWEVIMLLAAERIEGLKEDLDRVACHANTLQLDLLDRQMTSFSKDGV